MTFCIYRTYKINLTVDGHLDFFGILAIVNSVAVSLDLQVSVQHSIQSSYYN